MYSISSRRPLIRLLPAINESIASQTELEQLDLAWCKLKKERRPYIHAFRIKGLALKGLIRPLGVF